MDAEYNLRVKWEGELSLDHIKWNKKKFQEHKLSTHFDPKIKACWDQHIEENPNDYDGQLVFIDDLHFKGDSLFLDTSCMKFSTATFMVKNEIKVEKGIGVLGVQYLVFSPKKDHILIGRRKLSESYFPGAVTIPGGILEINDLYKLPKEALMREVYEEIDLPLKSDAFLIAIVSGWNNVSVTFLISASLVSSYNLIPHNKILAKDNEWEGWLKWCPLDKLKELKKNQLLDGLIYYISKLERS